MNRIVKLPIILFFVLLYTNSSAQSFEAWNFEFVDMKTESNIKKFKPKDLNKIEARKVYNEDIKYFDIEGNFDGYQLQDGSIFMTGFTDFKPWNKGFTLKAELKNKTVTSGSLIIFETFDDYYHDDWAGRYEFERIFKNEKPTDFIQIKGTFRDLEIEGKAKLIFFGGIIVDIYYDSIFYKEPDGNVNILEFEKRSVTSLPLGKIVYKNGDVYIGEHMGKYETVYKLNELYSFTKKDKDSSSFTREGKGKLFKADGTAIRCTFEKNKPRLSHEYTVTFKDETYSTFYLSTDTVITFKYLKDGKNNKTKRVFIKDKLIAEEGDSLFAEIMAIELKKELAAKLKIKIQREKDSIYKEEHKYDVVDENSGTKTYSDADLHCVTYILEKSSTSLGTASTRYNVIYVQVEDFTHAASESEIMSAAESVVYKEVNLNGFRIEEEILDDIDCEDSKKILKDAGWQFSSFRKTYAKIK